MEPECSVLEGEVLTTGPLGKSSVSCHKHLRNTGEIVTTRITGLSDYWKKSMHILEKNKEKKKLQVTNKQ